MNGQQKMHFKECNPKETVERLKGILSNIGAEIEEKWIEENCIGTYSLRINIRGTDIGTNGKGITKEYALASAYAEFFERYQNNMLIYFNEINDNDSDELLDDEIYMTAYEIISQNDPFIGWYFKMRNLENISIDEKVEKFEKLNKCNGKILNNVTKYSVNPFYHVNSGNVYYLPNFVYMAYTGSNGMAAGNTPEEAIVQGMSEIFERVANNKLYDEYSGLPDIPNNYIMNYPYIYEMFNKLKKIKGYSVKLKDCSFGEKIPVAGLLIIKKNTGKYGVKLGCHPDWGIAMERAFTEAAQGIDILEYTSRSTIDFNNKNINNWINKSNGMKIGLSNYPYQIIGNYSNYKFEPKFDVSNMNNSQIMNYYISVIKETGYDILIRDVSWFEFPSYHIIIPGLSEMLPSNDETVKGLNSRRYVSKLLHDVKKIDSDDCHIILRTLSYYSGSYNSDSLSSYYLYKPTENLPYENIGCGVLYFAAMCNIFNKEYVEAAKKVEAIEKNLFSLNSLDFEYIWIKALKQYLYALNIIKDNEKVMEYMYKLFDQSICLKLNNLMSDTKNIIIKQYSKYESNKTEYDISNKYRKILKEAKIKNSINQHNLNKLFINL